MEERRIKSGMTEMLLYYDIIIITVLLVVWLCTLLYKISRLRWVGVPYYIILILIPGIN